MRDVRGPLDGVSVRRHQRVSGGIGQDISSGQIESYLVPFFPELVHNRLLVGVLRAELPDAMKLIGENTPHAEGGPGQEAALDAIIEPVELVGFRRRQG
jgi:hypothetical protein